MAIESENSMKCTNCTAEINPKWTHAVNMNLCPFCGKEIMSSEIKDLLSALTSTIESLSSYPEYLDDWLGTHGYVKRVLVKQTVNHGVAKSISHNDPEIEGEFASKTVSVHDQEKTNKFFKNARVGDVVNKTQHLKSLVSKIKSSAPETDTVDMENLNPEEIEEYQLAMSDYTDNTITSALKQDDYEDEIPPAALALSQLAGKSDMSNAKDLMRLQQLQNKTADARDRMLSGSSGKGGFSRS